MSNGYYPWEEVDVIEKPRFQVISDTVCQESAYHRVKIVEYAEPGEYYCVYYMIVLQNLLPEQIGDRVLHEQLLGPFRTPGELQALAEGLRLWVAEKAL